MNPAEDREFRVLVGEASNEDTAGNSWAPIDLAGIVAGVQAGELVGPIPSLMCRTDGVALAYPGEVHSLAGEPESGKGWLALSETARLLTAGENVLYLDFEDAPASIVTRLLGLGAPAAAIVARFSYVRPEDPLNAETFRELLDVRPYALAVLDGLSEAYALLGLDLSDNTDVARFLTTLPRPIAATGAAVVQIDHVPKAKDARGRYALGGQHKLAGVAVAYTTEVITAPSRQGEGMIKVRVEKDRHGHVRGHAVGGVVALMHVCPVDDGELVEVRLEPPAAPSTDDDGNFRPTVLMERVSRYLDANPGVSMNTIREGVSGKSTYLDQAVRQLVAEEYVEQRREGQAKLHFNVRGYSDDA